MSDTVRLQVDKATREVLEQLCDQLDSEPGWAARLRSDLSDRITSESDTVREHTHRISESIVDLALRTTGVSEIISHGLDEVGRKLDHGEEAAGGHAKAAGIGLRTIAEGLEDCRTEFADVARRTESIQARLEAMGAGTEEGIAAMRDTLAGLTEALGRQQAQITELSIAFQRVSRPWWKKVFGG